MSLETNEACTVILSIHGARVDVTILLEDVSELAVFVALW